jgi:hypothetical protein
MIVEADFVSCYYSVIKSVRADFVDGEITTEVVFRRMRAIPNKSITDFKVNEN